jgi:2-haloacid dehalogenase
VDVETRWATFDCFGTLVDWRHGIATGAELLFPGRGAQLLDAYNRQEPRVQREQPAMRYRDLLAEALRRAVADEGLEFGAPDDADILGATIPSWPVFADVRPALEELRAAGWRLALLTNCDRDIIGATQRRLRVPFDAAVTAEDVGAYKPAHQHFHRFAEAFGVDFGSAGWVHVAQSRFHDMVPAKELNIPRVWINRLGEPDDGSVAGAVLPGLEGLAAAVSRVRTRD